MTDLAYAVELSLEINGAIRVKPYKENVMPILNAIDLWEFDDINCHKITKFGDQTWKLEEGSLQTSFKECSPKFAFQLKAMTLGMYSQGAGEGMVPLSLKSIGNVISRLKRFGCWIYCKYGLSGLDELNSLEELKIRNIINELISDFKINEYPSLSLSLLNSMNWAHTYQLITTPYIHDLMKEILSPYILLAKERHNKYSIIPPRMLKIVLTEAELHVEKSQQFFSPWSEIQLYINRTISSQPSRKFKKSTYINVLSLDEKDNLDKYHYTIYTLSRYVFILIIGYTGMRYSEAMQLPDDAAFDVDGKYFLKTMLSKTTDGTQSLEWVTNKVTYDAVRLLSKVNQIYRERAQLLLKHHATFLSDSRRHNMLFGIKNKQLFNVKQNLQSCEFNKNIKSRLKVFTSIKTLFPITVTNEDIALLDKMGCNYQSISARDKLKGKPYQVGDSFNFTAHQFRHTFAWFIIANRLGDLDDIKYQYKHLDSCMTYVYGERGYESMQDLLALTNKFSEFMISQTMTEIVQAAENGVLAGRGGQSFITRISEILNDNLNTGNSPHFSNMQELISFTSKHSNNFRGLSHGYCTKGNACKVRNAADPSHCVFCDSYIATPKHLPHWQVIKQRCETQLQAFDKFPDEMKSRFLSFSTALNDNLNAANTIIDQLTIQPQEVKNGNK